MQDQVLETVGLLANHGLEWTCALHDLVAVILSFWHDALVVLNHFGRQFLQDVFLSPPQNERSNPSLKRFECCDELLGVFKFFLHFLDVAGKVLVVHFVEGGLILQKVGHNKVEQGPKLRDSVLEWRA